MKTICVYEMAVWSGETLFCPICKEYDGLMPLNLETLAYLGEDPADWKDEL